jgi:hypothetical protein
MDAMRDAAAAIISHAPLLGPAAATPGLRR